MQFLPLIDIISPLLDGTKLTLNVSSMSNIFHSDLTKLPVASFLHTSSFCIAAKTTQKGHSTCMYCKRLCIKAVARRKKPFWGMCAHGLTEYVYPVYIGDELKCILFIGNMVMDQHKAVERIRKTCRKTGVPPEKLIAQLHRAEHNADPKKIQNIARLFESYLVLLSEKSTYKSQEHPAVTETVTAIHAFYSEQLTLADCAKKAFINEKYLGRIFKEQTGYTFHEYLNHVRLTRARTLLIESRLSITNIALECGFSSAQYFNRNFKKKFGVSPGEQRKNKMTLYY